LCTQLSHSIAAISADAAAARLTLSAVRDQCIAALNSRFSALDEELAAAEAAKTSAFEAEAVAADNALMAIQNEKDLVTRAVAPGKHAPGASISDPPTLLSRSSAAPIADLFTFQAAS
jgi:hypothetical protein